MEVGIDLKAYGPIALNDNSLKRQGYLGKNLLAESAKVCFRRNIKVCAVTSEDPQIVPGSLTDRFGFYRDNFLADLPNHGMSGGMLKEIGGNVMVVAGKNGQEVYFVNSQAVISLDNRHVRGDGKIGGRRAGHIVFGNNNIKQFETPEDTVRECYESGLPNFVYRAGAEENAGLGKEAAKRVLTNPDICHMITDIVTHDAQSRFGQPTISLLKLIPSGMGPISSFAEQVGKYNRGTDKKARRIAISSAYANFEGESHFYKGVSVSNAHRIKDIGLSCITTDNKHLSLSSDEGVLFSIDDLIRRGEFENVRRYESVSGWFDWTVKFALGARANDYNHVSQQMPKKIVLDFV